MERRYTLAAVTPSGETTPLYVEVAQDETLDEIAIRLSKGSNRSYLHMMYALFLANPDAFYRGNMNNLKTGRTLRVPSNEELYALSDREVFAGIRSQYEQWQQLRESGEQRGTRAGEALAGMSDEQAAALDLSANPAEIERQLGQVHSESEVLRRENEELRRRLQALEQRLQSVAGQVLEYADADGTETLTPAPQAQDEKQSEKPVDKGEDADEQAEGLSGSTLFAAIVMALLFVLYIVYSTGHPHRGRS
jgi:pilus assembly protein FimV